MKRYKVDEEVRRQFGTGFMTNDSVPIRLQFVHKSNEVLTSEIVHKKMYTPITKGHIQNLVKKDLIHREDASELLEGNTTELGAYVCMDSDGDWFITIAKIYGGKRNIEIYMTEPHSGDTCKSSYSSLQKLWRRAFILP